jgi:hypothetical protein
VGEIEKGDTEAEKMLVSYSHEAIIQLKELKAAASY